MDIEVTSVSKAPQALGEAAAAVTVVTQDDIKRLGATNIPEALRSVPGITVSQLDSNEWAVSSRGFSSVDSEKLLVLSDTRSIYTPLFSGVFWDVQDYLMEDIDRIEVIRGPGGTLWGADAVNGVINITTKSAADTQGAYTEVLGGTQDRAIVGGRYGGQFDDNTFYRVFAQYSDRSATFHPELPSQDGWHLGHVGFRMDSKPTVTDAFTVQGDAYTGNVGQIAPDLEVSGRPTPQGQFDVGVSGGNLLARWRHDLGADSDLEVRAYYDYTHRNDPAYVDDLDTTSLDVQHRFRVASHVVTWGMDYTLMVDETPGKGIVAFDPQSSRDPVYSGFIQDQVTLSDSLQVTVGTKLEHNDFSGFEAQPSARVAWTPTARQTFWSAVSRAVRVPTRIERDIDIDASSPDANPELVLQGNKHLHAETVVAYEAGYRRQVLTTLSIDVATFYNRYASLVSLEPGAAYFDPATGRTVIPILDENKTDGRSRGLELLATFSPTARLHLTATYSYVDLVLTPSGLDLNGGKLLDGATPRNEISLRSYLDLQGGFQVNGELRSLSAIEESSEFPPGESVPAYTELNLGLQWHGSRETTVSVLGQNLLHRRHMELLSSLGGTEIDRGVYAKVEFRL